MHSAGQHPTWVLLKWDQLINRSEPPHPSSQRRRSNHRPGHCRAPSHPGFASGLATSGLVVASPLGVERRRRRMAGSPSRWWHQLGSKARPTHRQGPDPRSTVMAGVQSATPPLGRLGTPRQGTIDFRMAGCGRRRCPCIQWRQSQNNLAISQSADDALAAELGRPPAADPDRLVLVLALLTSGYELSSQLSQAPIRDASALKSGSGVGCNA